MNFNTIVLARDSLQSNVVRNLIGDRVIDLAGDLVVGGDDNDGGLLGQIFSFGKKLVGFVVQSVLGVVYWGLSELWDVTVEAYFELKYFDWNQTDEELRQSLKDNDANIAGALGRLTGTGLVWLTGIAVSTSLSFKFPVLAGRVALELAQEGGQEIRSAIINLILVARRNAIKSMLVGGLLNARKLELFGQKSVTTERKPWSFADGIENFIERLPSTALRSFTEQFIDSVEDSVIEMGYVIAYTIDDYYASQTLANQSILGQERTIVITPDVETEEEQIIIEAPQELTIAEAQNVIANHQLVYNRDLGQIVGTPEEDYVRPRPQRRKLQIIFKSKPKPPWRMPNGDNAKTIECNIPDFKPAVSWSTLKSVIKHFTWGKFQVTAHLDNERQMRVHAVSYSEGEKYLNELIKLSTANIRKFTHSVIATDDPDPKKRIVPTVVYPAYCKLILGDIRPDGSLRSKRKDTTRVNLWVDTEPEQTLEPTI